MVNIEYPSP